MSLFYKPARPVDEINQKEPLMKQRINYQQHSPNLQKKLLD
jgi:hypothetical protein